MNLAAPTPSRRTSMSPEPGSARIPPWWALGYLVVYLLLDWVSYIHPWQGLNITPWSPQQACAVALLIRNRRWLWVVWLSLVVAELVVRGVPARWEVMLMSSAALSLGYAAIARLMALRLDLSRVLAAWRDLLTFGAVVIVGALLCGVLYVGSLTLGGVGPEGSLAAAVGRYWVGDAVGLLVLLPMLLMLGNPVGRARLRIVVGGAEWWGIAATIAAAVWFVFGRAEQEYFKFFYLLFMPVAWAAGRLGTAGAVLAAALTQLCLIVAVQSLEQQSLAVFELQVLMAALTGMGLMLGGAVDERERVAAELRGSLRLAAAGEMAAAIAHELNQPLTALSSYAQACRLIADDLARLQPDTRLPLADVARRMVEDARRASDVVKRLRDFFRTGSTNLQATDMAQLLRDQVGLHERRAQALDVRLELICPSGLPPVLVDPVQIAVVLRNLVSNAIEAATQGGEHRAVTVTARVAADTVLVEVVDSGDGLEPSGLQRPFEAQQSAKPGGMGIGLSISRAIVEAHGGRLWAEPGPGGRFCITLPHRPAEAEDSRHAQ